METETIHTVIQLIDKQLSKVELKKDNKPAVDHLLELRNYVLIKYKPNPNIDWTIKNKKMLGFFSKELVWKI